MTQKKTKIKVKAKPIKAKLGGATNKLAEKIAIKVREKRKK